MIFLPDVGDNSQTVRMLLSSTDRNCILGLKMNFENIRVLILHS